MLGVGRGAAELQADVGTDDEERDAPGGGAARGGQPLEDAPERRALCGSEIVGAAALPGVQDGFEALARDRAGLLVRERGEFFPERDDFRAVGASGQMLLDDLILFRAQGLLQVVRQELRNLFTLHGQTSGAENFAARRAAKNPRARTGADERLRAVPAARDGCGL